MKKLLTLVAAGFVAMSLMATTASADAAKGQKIYQKKVKDLVYPYIKPQETGNRMEIRYMSLLGSNGHGLLITATGEHLLQGGAYPALMSDYESTLNTNRHPYDIPSRDTITVNIDHAQRGLGGRNSWGAHPLPKHILPTNKTYSYSFNIQPK